MLRWWEQFETKLRSIAARPQIASLMAEFGMVDDPLAEANSLYEHFGFLLKSGVAPERIALRVLSSPKWFRRSLELRRSGASHKVIFWTLTDQGRLCKRGASPLFGGIYPWVFNKLVDLFKESILSNKVWSGIVAVLLAILCVTRFQKMWHGDFLLNALFVIVGFFGANGFAYNLYPPHMFEEKAQQDIAGIMLFFLALWLLTALVCGVFAMI